MEEKEIKFAVQLRSERGRLMWSRKKMSEKTGIPVGTIKGWEEETAEPAVYIKRMVLADLRGRKI